MHDTIYRRKKKKDRTEQINHTAWCARHVRVIIVPETFRKWVVIYLQLCDLKKKQQNNTIIVNHLYT